VVFMIAVMGLVSLQRATLGAGDMARQQTAAVNIAQFFTTEIKTEFANWNQWQSGSDLSATQFPLIAAAGAGLVTDSTWQQLGGNNFRVDDFVGHSAIGTSGENDYFSRYCVNYMITRLEDSDVVSDPAVWLIRVRVSWTKDGYIEGAGSAWKDCTPNTVTARINNTQRDHAVELVAGATREVAPIP